MNGDWKAEGLCAQTDPELWFPEKGGSTRMAKLICGQCPVRLQCLAYGLALRVEHGIWGGLTYKELRHLRHERDAA